MAEPERMDNPNAKFEGWLKFKVNEWDEKEDCELIDATLYTTADMLNSKVPEYDVMYVAKWSDIPLSYYFYQGEMYRVYFEAMNGTLHYEKYSGDSDDLDSYFAAEEESPQLMITFNSNGGNIKLEYPDENGKTLEEWVDIYGVENYDGLNVKESLELERTTIASIKKKMQHYLAGKFIFMKRYFQQK